MVPIEFVGVLVTLVVATGHLFAQSQPPAPIAPPSTSSAPLAFLREHCAKCHGGEDVEGDFRIEALDDADPTDDLGEWLRAREALDSGDMPPDDEPQPAATARALALDAIARHLTAIGDARPADPGRVTMRRLSRVEYQRTIFDLTGVSISTESLPNDDLAHGFDNHGDARSLSPLHLEKFADLALVIADRALPDEEPAVPIVRRVDGVHLESSLPDTRSANGVMLISNGEASARFELPRAGRYRIGAQVWGMQAGDEVVKMRLRVDGRNRAVFDVLGTRGAPETHWIESDLREKALVGAYFLNDHYAPNHPDPSQRDRNLFVAALMVEGPLDRREPMPLETWLSSVDPARGSFRQRSSRVLDRLLPRVLRRPVGATERARYLAAMTARESSGMRAALRDVFAAMLVSPSFLFRAERAARTSAGIEPLDDTSMAVRLSYFLWSTTPDAPLLEVARKKSLSRPEVLVETARRMLRDPRAEALATNFAAQWLELRRLDELAMDPQRFPEFDRELAWSMRRETELLFRDVLTRGAPVSELLTATHGFVDERLGKLYGIEVERGAAFARLKLPNERQVGLLGHAGILALTSHPTRTSVVRRGKWVLTELLDDPPPPPAPGSDSFPPNASVEDPADMRKQLALHRENPACATCHDSIDPLGLALEALDPLGRVREVDATSTLRDGTRLASAVDLRDWILARNRLPRTLLHKLFHFALGRDLRPADVLALEGALDRLPDDPTIEDLILAIVELPAFTSRAPARD
jgi:mono/diheme cytochrome c family protein